MEACSEDLHCRNDSDAVLVICRSYRFGENAFETVEKIATGDKGFHKRFVCVLVCIPQHINKNRDLSQLMRKIKKTY